MNLNLRSAHPVWGFSRFLVTKLGYHAPEHYLLNILENRRYLPIADEGRR